MRIASVLVQNYKGIRLANAGEVQDEPLVVLSGLNGTGKSLVLEAIVYVWAARYGFEPIRIGPFGDTARVRITLNLSEDEKRAIYAWDQAIGASNQSMSEADLTVDVSWDTYGRNTAHVQGWAIAHLRNPNFRLQHSFAVIDFLPAVRLLPNQQSVSIDPALLRSDRVESERTNLLDQYIQQRAPMQLTGVANFLAVLDYMDAIALRKGVQRSSEFDAIAGIFGSATGKSLLRPDPDTNENIDVTVDVGGNRHSIDDLSSGEKEMLSLMYFVRRLSSSGGVLLVDEPEQHLHPSLQSAIFRTISQLGDKGQVLCVTHSPNNIASLSSTAVFQMSPPDHSADEGQLQRVVESSSRRQLLSDLGISVSDVAQYEGLLVVEGGTDKTYLSQLIGPSLARFSVVVAGDCSRVEQYRNALVGTDSLLPWHCVIDRDLREDSAFRHLLAQDDVFCWPGSAIESVFIDPDLITRTIERAGGSVADVNGTLESLAAEQKEAVARELTKSRLVRDYPVAEVDKTLSEVDKLAMHLSNRAASYQNQAAHLGATLASTRIELDQRWTSDWPHLVDPKILLRRFVQAGSTPYSTHDRFIQASIQCALEEEGYMPESFKALASVLDDALASRR